MDVRLGPVGPGSVAATAFALVERGCLRRPDLAARLPAITRVDFDEGYPPVRIDAGTGLVVVGDEALMPSAATTLVVRGPLPELVAQLTVPLAGGVPSPLRREGRAVLRAVAAGTVRVDGRLGDGLTLLRLLSLLG